jgi:hypothetical protein
MVKVHGPQLGTTAVDRAAVDRARLQRVENRLEETEGSRVRELLFATGPKQVYEISLDALDQPMWKYGHGPVVEVPLQSLNNEEYLGLRRADVNAVAMSGEGLFLIRAEHAPRRLEPSEARLFLRGLQTALADSDRELAARMTEAEALLAAGKHGEANVSLAATVEQIRVAEENAEHDLSLGYPGGPV